jgi:uncharacterized protein (DUF1501 family)
LANPDGPRVGALALDGWDTRNNEGVVNGRLAQLLGALDAALGAIETNVGARLERDRGDAYHRVRTHRPHQRHRRYRSRHRDRRAAVGRRAQGGHVVADWPGVKEADLHEKRDLKATTDLRAVLKGLLRDHLRVDERALTADIFPGSDAVAPMTGLLA